MFRALSWSAAIAAFALAVLGSWIRINGAGLTCPDWPLCQGQIIPPLSSGVLLEWSHRMVAFLEAFLVVGALGSAWRRRDRIAFIRPVVAFIAFAFAVQVVLGAATVALGNNPASVVLHWATGMMFLAGLAALAILALAEPVTKQTRPTQSGLFAVLGTSVLSAFAAMCAGAYVSSSGSGLACLSFPSCDGNWLGTSSAQFAQMLHRAAAGTFVVLAIVAAYWAASAATRRVRFATLTGLALLSAQVFFGIANVLWALPSALRVAHAATAGLTFIAFIAAFIFARLDGTVAVRRVTRVRPPRVQKSTLTSRS